LDQKIPTGGEKIIQCLEREGVDYVFGLSGGAAMPMFDALLDSKIQLILTRHEQGATHMADGYARSSGRPGVALVTSGPSRRRTSRASPIPSSSTPISSRTGQTSRA
jgi:acetolactate synthase-1/2/3 large subunit